MQASEARFQPCTSLDPENVNQARVKLNLRSKETTREVVTASHLFSFFNVCFIFMCANIRSLYYRTHVDIGDVSFEVHFGC